jgi:hypothetical protein
MQKLILLLALIVGIGAPMAGAQLVQSGNLSVDLSQYHPGQNGQPFLPRSNGLINPGFETGSLPPWTTDNWTVTNTDYYSGVYCAQDIENHWIRQDFSPIPVAGINSVTLWERQPSGPAFGAIDFFYSPSDYDEFLVAPGDGWTFEDITSFLRSTGSLTAIRIWGYSGPSPELTRIDDVAIDVQGTPAQETSWGWVKVQYQQ